MDAVATPDASAPIKLLLKKYTMQNEIENNVHHRVTFSITFESIMCPFVSEILDDAKYILKYTDSRTRPDMFKMKEKVE